MSRAARPAMQVYDLRNEFQGHFAAVRTSTRYLVVHHAAADYPPYFGRDDVQAIANYHVKTRGWAGVGYHEVLAQETNNGPIAAYIVSRPDTVRAHIAGRNHECFGLCMAANFSRTTPPQQWLDALALRLVEAKRRWPAAQIVGHRDITLPGYATSCPGDRWAAWRPALLAQVASMLKTPPPAPAPAGHARYVLVSPCSPLTARSPSAPLAGGVVFAFGDRVNVGDITDGWLWVSDKETTAPGIGFIPSAYARRV